MGAGPTERAGGSSSHDVLIVGAGPAGLFAAFELNLFGLSCHIVDALDRPGGQCVALYADKPIYDLPGVSSVLAGTFVEGLCEQLKRFDIRMTLRQALVGVQRTGDGLRAVSKDGSAFEARVIVLATGLGSLAEDSGAVQETWAVQRGKHGIGVDRETFATSEPGLFAIGDAAGYAGKLRLLVSACHEGALMTQSVRRLLKPESRAGHRQSSASPTLQKALRVRQA